MLLLHLCGKRNTNPGKLPLLTHLPGPKKKIEVIHQNLSNHIPSIIIGICNVSCMALLLIIRYVLSKENKRRDQEPLDDSCDGVYIERIGKDGQVERVKVDKVNLFFNFFMFTM